MPPRSRSANSKENDFVINHYLVKLSNFFIQIKDETEKGPSWAPPYLIPNSLFPDYWNGGKMEKVTPTHPPGNLQTAVFFHIETNLLIFETSLIVQIQPRFYTDGKSGFQV